MNIKPPSSELTKSMKEKIRAGIKAGLADAKAGRGHELTDEFIEALKNEAERRIRAKNLK